MNINFKGQTILITGATKGIGKQVAEDMYKLGEDLILTGTNKEQIANLNKKNANKSIRHIAVDFLDEKNTNEFLDLISNYKKIDVCINNAGINRINYIDETLVKDWRDIITVNIEAPFLIT